MVSYLTFLKLCNLRKPYTVLERVKPFTIRRSRWRRI